MENKFYKCKCNSGSFNGNCPVCEPKEEKVCERNCPDYNGMNILHKEDCNCSCHDEPKEEPKDVWVEFDKILLPPHNNIEPIDDFNRGYLRAIELVKGRINHISTHFISRAELEKVIKNV